MSKKYPLHTLPPEEAGKRFSTFRTQAGLSIGQAAMLTNVDREEVVKTEDGRYEQVAAGLIIKLAEAYGCPVSNFFVPELIERDPVTVFALLAMGEVSEGYAARLLGCDRLELRTRMEEHESSQH